MRKTKKKSARGNGRRTNKAKAKKAGPIAKAATRSKSSGSTSSISVAGDLKSALAAKAKAAGYPSWKSFSTEILTKAAQA